MHETMKTLNTQNSATHASKNEGGIIHEIINLNDAITNSVESVLGVRIANTWTQRKPSD